jgi:hypothetical protein
LLLACLAQLRRLPFGAAGEDPRFELDQNIRRLGDNPRSRRCLDISEPL